MKGRNHWRAWGVAGAIVLLSTGTARAANGSRPRTPPAFLNASCLEVVDHDERSVVHLSLGIPFEDVMLTADELPDSRRFQFFALCRDQLRAHPLPPWIDDDDVERSLAAGLLERPPPPKDVLEHDPTWSDCVFPITRERMPIDCASTTAGISWDTSALPVGNYVVRGYTFEPPVNLWTARPGVISIVRGEERPPVVALDTPARENLRTHRDPGLVIEGCMGGPDGTTVTLRWARIRDLDVDEPTDWHAFASVPHESESDVRDGRFAVTFLPPADAVNQAVAIAAEAVSPDGQRFVAFAPGTLVVQSGSGEAPMAAAGPPPNACGVPEDPPAELEEDDDDDDDGDRSSSCGCGPSSRDSPWSLLALVVVARTVHTRRTRASVPDSSCGRDRAATSTASTRRP